PCFPVGAMARRAGAGVQFRAHFIALLLIFGERRYVRTARRWCKTSYPGANGCSLPVGECGVARVGAYRPVAAVKRGGRCHFDGIPQLFPVRMPQEALQESTLRAMQPAECRINGHGVACVPKEQPFAAGTAIWLLERAE